MNDVPRHRLSEMIVEHGRSICRNPARCQALLNDYCGEYKREINVLITALNNQVPDELINAPAGSPINLGIAKLSRRLQADLGLTSEAANWAVDSWAIALGILSLSDNATSNLSVNPDLPREGVLPSQIAQSSNSLLAGRYQVNNDGTLIDTQTQLHWLRFSIGQTWQINTVIGKTVGVLSRNIDDRIHDFNDKGHAGYKDWRLPTKSELLSIIYCSSGQPTHWNITGNKCIGDCDCPTLYLFAFPNTPTYQPWYWTSTINADNGDKRRFINFTNGSIQDPDDDYTVAYIRLVRHWH